jgi:hypothetical protein
MTGLGGGGVSNSFLYTYAPTVITKIIESVKSKIS